VIGACVTPEAHRILVTIGLSHYCEKARWALRKADLPFVEQAYAPGLHLWAVRRAGGTHSTPVLVDDGRVIADSTDILEHIQRHPRARWRPFPAGDAGVAARALEARFDEELGPHARRLAYHHLLHDPPLLLRMVRRSTSARQTRAFGLLLPLLRPLMQKSMRIDAAGADRSLARINAMFDDVDRLLADGRHYLAGDRFTGADLTLAALGAVAVLPPEMYPTALHELPPAFAAQVSAWRARPTGAFVLRMCSSERWQSAHRVLPQSRRVLP
jgi:glutathione S-transferase